MKDLFSLKWGEDGCDFEGDWETPMEYVEWTCSYCGNVNSGKSIICLKCNKKHQG